MAKIKVLVVPSDLQGGVGFFRSTQPHIQLEKQYGDDFEVTINASVNFRDLEYFDKFDIVHIHKGLFKDMGGFYNAMKYMKGKGIKTIMDLDDHWKLDPHHPQYVSQKAYKLDQLVCNNFALFDYITTTTKIFANEIKKYNKNVLVFPNAIDPTDSRFTTNKTKSDKIRIGMIMGSTHEHDVALLNGMVNKLPQDVKDKIQFVLCGYDLRGTMKIINTKTGEEQTRPIQPLETVWYRYEKLITDNYAIVSDDYKNFLLKFIPDSEYPNVENEAYRRCWTKDMNHYYEHYNNVDVLLAPIEVRDFNKVKSQLKAIECCFSHTALIASDYGPYQIDLVSAIEKGGKINPNGNALLVDENKNHKDWAKYIEKIVKNPELLEQLKNNIYETLHDKFDLRNVTDARAKFYKEIVNKE